MEKNKFEGLDTITEYLAARGDGKPVETDGLEWIIESIVSKTDLSYFEAEQIVRLYFQEIRNFVLNEYVVILKKLGSFLLVSPKTTGSMKKIFPKFKISKSLSKMLNGRN